MVFEQKVKLSQVLEVWESYSGWYWFTTEYHEDDLAFGLVKGHEIELGYFDMSELRQLAHKCKAWPVPKKNWFGCPCIIDDTREGEQSPPAARRGEDQRGAAA